MKAYVMDAFTSQVLSGNQAGVVLPNRDLSDETMQRVAAEFKHSETAFIKINNDKSISLRYFTPAGEVDLCGHATIGSFALLRTVNMIGDGTVTAHTKAGDLNIEVADGAVWMDMAAPSKPEELDEDSLKELYGAYGLSLSEMPQGLTPQIVSTGLADIIMPVKSKEALMKAVQNERAVSELSRKYNAVGVHMFCPGDGVYKAFCSNFAPLVGIPEECATGTANGALTYYLYTHGLLESGEESVFLQGEHMGRPSEVRSRLMVSGAGISVKIGGWGVMSLECDLKI